MDSWPDSALADVVLPNTWEAPRVPRYDTRSPEDFMAGENLITALAPVFAALEGADPSDPALADRLNEVLPLSGDVCAAVRAAAEAEVAAGRLCHREAGGIAFSRPVKPSADSAGFSVDAVVMEDVVGPRHTHTSGEINLCFAQSGEPRFDGHAAGWVVFPPGSTHRPRVDGGRMLILYFLPDGAVEFHRD